MNSVLKLGFIVVALLGLSACSFLEPRVEYVPEPMPITCDTPPSANAVVMRDVNPTVIKDEYGIYWIGITPKGYENLSLNIADIKEHIEKKNAVVRYYTSCIENHNQIVELEKDED